VFSVRQEINFCRCIVCIKCRHKSYIVCSRERSRRPHHCFLHAPRDSALFKLCILPVECADACSDMLRMNLNGINMLLVVGQCVFYEGKTEFFSAAKFSDSPFLPFRSNNKCSTPHSTLPSPPPLQPSFSLSVF
jgi:hypothetical protein